MNTMNLLNMHSQYGYDSDLTYTVQYDGVYMYNGIDS